MSAGSKMALWGHTKHNRILSRCAMKIRDTKHSQNYLIKQQYATVFWTGCKLCLLVFHDIVIILNRHIYTYTYTDAISPIDESVIYKMQHQPVCPDILPNWSSSFSARAARCWLKNLKIFVQIGGWCSTAAHTHSTDLLLHRDNRKYRQIYVEALKDLNVSMSTELSKLTSSQMMTMLLMVAGDDRNFTFWFKYCYSVGWQSKFTGRELVYDTMVVCVSPQSALTVETWEEGAKRFGVQIGTVWI